MSSGTSVFAFRMILLVINSWFFYGFDRRFGRSWYRRWYNLSHEDELSPEVVRGFVCGRPGKTQFYMSVVLALLTVVVMTFIFEDTLLTWFVTWVAGVIATLIGFITGPLVLNLWRRRDVVFSAIDRKVFPAIDKIDSGDFRPGQSIRQAGQKARSRLSGLLGQLGWSWNSPQPLSKVTPEVSAPAPAPTPVVTGNESVADLLTPGSASQTEAAPVGSNGGQAPAREPTPEELISQYTGHVPVNGAPGEFEKRGQ